MDTEVTIQQINHITADIVHAALRIHSALGPGLFESVYETVLARDLAVRGLQVVRQMPVTFEFEGMHFEEGFRADLVVERTVIVEVKSVAELARPLWPLCEQCVPTAGSAEWTQACGHAENGQQSDQQQ